MLEFRRIPCHCFPGPGSLGDLLQPKPGPGPNPLPTVCGPTLEKPDPYCGHRPPSVLLLPAPG